MDTTMLCIWGMLPLMRQPSGKVIELRLHQVARKVSVHCIQVGQFLQQYPDFFYNKVLRCSAIAWRYICDERSNKLRFICLVVRSQVTGHTREYGLAT